jgi:hypothetical protein
MASVRKHRRLAFEFLASTIQEGPEERQRQQVYESFMRVMAVEWGVVVPAKVRPELLWVGDRDNIPLAPR